MFRIVQSWTLRAKATRSRKLARTCGKPWSCSSKPLLRRRSSSVANTNPLDDLRRLCLALPEVTERLSHREPTWFIQGRKTFVMFANHHHDDRLAFWCAAPDGAQETLVANDPERFF